MGYLFISNINIDTDSIDETFDPTTLDEFYTTQVANEIIEFDKPLDYIIILPDLTDLYIELSEVDGNSHIVFIPVDNFFTLDAHQIKQIRVLGASEQKIKYHGLTRWLYDGKIRA